MSYTPKDKPSSMVLWSPLKTLYRFFRSEYWFLGSGKASMVFKSRTWEGSPVTLIPTGMFIVKSVGEHLQVSTMSFYSQVLEDYAALQMPETNILKWRIYNAKRAEKNHCFFTHGILESWFLLWGLYLLICIRTVECCTKVWRHNRWCITISSCSCFLARENFWFRYSLLLECFPDGKKCKTKVTATELRTRKSHSRAPYSLLRSFQSRSGGLTVECARAKNRSPGWARPAAQSNSLGTADSPLTCADSWGDKHQEY